MSLQQMMLMMLGNEVGGVITLTDPSLPTATKSGNTARRFFKIDQDGYAYTKKNQDLDTAYTLVNSSTDWCRPISLANAGYQFMADNFGGNATSSDRSTTSATGVWHPINNSDWIAQVWDDTGGTNTVITFTFDLHVRFETGGTIDSCSVSISANRFDT